MLAYAQCDVGTSLNVRLGAGVGAGAGSSVIDDENDEPPPPPELPPDEPFSGFLYEEINFSTSQSVLKFPLCAAILLLKSYVGAFRYFVMVISTLEAFFAVRSVPI